MHYMNNMTLRENRAAEFYDYKASCPKENSFLVTALLLSYDKYNTGAN